MFKTFAFVLACCCWALVIASGRDERNLLGWGMGHIGNMLWTKDMQVEGCKNHGFCNTPLCLEGIKGGNGIFWLMGVIAAGATTVAAHDMLSAETHKAACYAAGMYDESKPRF